MIKNVIKIRIILWHILAFIILFFVYMAIVPSGHIAYTYDFKKENSFISRLSPLERVQVISNGTQKIIGDPIYFSLRTPRVFNKAIVSFEYKNNNPFLNPIIESGILVDKTVWRYKLKPVDNYFLDYLFDEWRVLEDDELSLFINPRATSSKYNSLKAFLNNPPSSEKVAVYNYDFKSDYQIFNYASSSERIIHNVHLRGPYQILTYIDNEDLYFDFNFLDLNKNEDKDQVDINLYYRDILIDTRHLDGDEIDNNSGEESELGSLNFELVNMPKGVYKIEVRVGDDIITRQITSKQNKISFLNKIWVADEKLSDFSVFTDSDIFHIQTSNPASIQTIKFASSTLDLKETFKQYSQKLSSSTSELQFEKGDIILAGNGVFSFQFSSLFNPSIKKIDSNFDLANTKVDYIIANYKKPNKKDDFFTKKIEINLDDVYREDSKYSFLLSIPGLKIDDKTNDSIELNKITIDLYGLNLSEKIKNIMKK